MTDDNVKGFHSQPMTDDTDKVGIFTKSEHLNDRLNECLDEDQAKFDILYERYIKNRSF